MHPPWGQVWPRILSVATCLPEAPCAASVRAPSLPEPRFQGEAAKGLAGSAGLWALRPLGSWAPELLFREAPQSAGSQQTARGRLGVGGRWREGAGTGNAVRPQWEALGACSCPRCLPWAPVLPLGSVPRSFFCFGAAGSGQLLPRGERELKLTPCLSQSWETEAGPDPRSRSERCVLCPRVTL